MDRYLYMIHRLVEAFMLAVCLQSFFTGNDDQKGALKLLFQLLCVQPKKGGGDLRYLFAEYEVSLKVCV